MLDNGNAVCLLRVPLAVDLQRGESSRTKDAGAIFQPRYRGDNTRALRFQERGPVGPSALLLSITRTEVQQLG